ncbi:MAG: Crp/Fnr family transcriptional regulator [Saprospiraceae bacterium]|nr:Crp/Fnr family transcriptional regulator [Saprospiraceae bacterium]
MTDKEIFRTLSFITEPALQQAILDKGHLVVSEAGKQVVREGEYVKILPIVLEGAIRVFQTRLDREILLYYVEPSQTCMMSLSACFYNRSSAIEAITTVPTTFLAIPVQYIAEWQRQYVSWNNFVIKTFRKRYDELLDAFESVAFEHIDHRIAEYLNKRRLKENTRLIEISHLQLAKELGTTRVVISRILKQFELQNKVKLHRGAIELL